MTVQQSDITPPNIERVRHELKRRTLTVTRCEPLTPVMRRIHLTSDDLGDFISAAPDDHIKLFFDTGGEKQEMRDYTPRHFDIEQKTLVIDFALHDAGPATAWAITAQPGDTLDIGGPRGSAVIREPVNHWVLIGDETALPAIGRRIEEAPAAKKITAIIAVPGPQDHQTFDTKANVTLCWIDRPAEQATDAAPFLSILKDISFEPETLVWAGAEANVVRALRAYLLEERDFPKSWMKLSGYWVKNKPGESEKNL
ncbi:siderophore-interacting protein [Martelella mediterranea]|uniref:NADPH-dependent ferric siderophore reductase n=1 Tax=Martelella mediterranea TaxID=293089 RepID=A0A4R3NXC9_9HYPH|nr:siderophore-interacting protein [Martelella mediterranea]TCT45044.1 NADPH-dependent ferric siderophore reductase [Martelella mediterranea]